MSSSQQITPFKPSIPKAEVDRLYTKLRETSVPKGEVVPGANNDYGVPQDWAETNYHYWLDTFSWSQAEAKLSQWKHFTTILEDLSIHFVHQRSQNPNAIPLLMVHGWPGSFYEFSEVINPLTAGEGGQAFHVIAPSLPGFVWSQAPQRRGWTMKDTARIFNALMQRLGYSQFCVQAGDWGQFVARELGAQYSERCKAVHLNWCPGALPEDVEPTEREAKCKAKGESWRTQHVGYAVLMRTRPQTLGWMLQDNPVGLLGFVGEKYEEAANPAIQSSTAWRDHVLTTVCLYYFTRCITTSSLVYYENPPHHEFAAYCTAQENLIKCPFGYTSMYFDTAPNSKRAVERTGNLVWYKERDYAGHFACLEDPKGMVADITEVVKKFWKE